MDNAEQVEKIRQGVMRFRELLDLLHERLDEGEQAYAQLFAHCTREEMETLKEKELQRRAALALVDDSSALRDAALHLRYVARDLERDFEQLHDNLVTPDENDD